MIKSIASFIGATALVMAPVAASAQTSFLIIFTAQPTPSFLRAMLHLETFSAI